jgi:hypothetical protein
MPIRLAPEAGAIGLKHVTPDGLDAAEEYISILDYMDEKVLKAAREAGRKTIGQGQRVREEFDQEAYVASLLNAQVKGWQLQDETGAALPFTPANLARLPWDLKSWLSDQIVSCGGIIPTETFRRDAGQRQAPAVPGPDEGVGTGPPPEVPATV